MNRQDFHDGVIDRTFTEMIKLSSTKGNDYSTEDNILSNFERNAERLGLSPEQVLMVYLNKHMDAIETYCREGAVKSEPIEGRIDDAILYLLLLKAMVVKPNQSLGRSITLEQGESLVPASRFRGASRAGGPVDPS